MKSILDPSFRYTASFNTDVRKTFAKARRAQTQGAPQASARTNANVSSIVGKVAKTR